MNNPAKNRLLTWAVVLLILANIATMTLFWLDKSKRPPHNREQPDQFIIKELALDKNQQDQFSELVAVHRQRAEQLRRQIRDAKDHFFGLLQQPATTDSMKTTSAAEVSLITQQLDILTFDHFRQVRTLCNDSQRAKFDDIINDVLRNMGGPPQGGGHPPPPPR